VTGTQSHNMPEEGVCEFGAAVSGPVVCRWWLEVMGVCWACGDGQVRNNMRNACICGSAAFT
jgi:hypothetical protein